MTGKHSWRKRKFFGLLDFKTEDLPKLAKDFARKTKGVLGRAVGTRIKIEKEVPRAGFFGRITDLIHGKQKQVLHKNPSQVTEDEMARHDISFEGVDHQTGNVVGEGGLLNQSAAEFSVAANDDEAAKVERKTDAPELQEEFEEAGPKGQENVIQTTLPEEVELMVLTVDERMMEDGFYFVPGERVLADNDDDDAFEEKNGPPIFEFKSAA